MSFLLQRARIFRVVLMSDLTYFFQFIVVSNFLFKLFTLFFLSNVFFSPGIIQLSRETAFIFNTTSCASLATTMRQAERYDNCRRYVEFSSQTFALLSSPVSRLIVLLLVCFRSLVLAFTFCFSLYLSAEAGAIDF